MSQGNAALIAVPRFPDTQQLQKWHNAMAAKKIGASRERTGAADGAARAIVEMLMREER
jgi:hypothetical protein